MMEFVTNNNGIRFLICCASCENRVLEVTGTRCGLVRAKPKPGKAMYGVSLSPVTDGRGKRKRQN